MARTVHQINAASGRPADNEPRVFSDFADRTNLVLLGDPGAGKTHLFRETAAAEGARLISARAFLTTPGSMLTDQTLFIDGLDEKRAGRGDRDTVDAMVRKLFEVGPRKVRISCRAPDWLGESDLAAFSPYFAQKGEPTVLLLDILAPNERRAVLAGQGLTIDAADAFLAEAQERGLDDFLENPQNLIMLWRAVQGGSWPATRKDLFELSTGLMLQEFDLNRARSGTGIYSVAELRPVAGAICAARLIADVEAISLTDQEGAPALPGYRSLTFLAPEKTQASLGRRIFVTGPAPESVDYAHRTTAEYLAAAFLADRIRAGLPLGRVIALMGVEGHPATELRGLHAWLAVHLPEYANQLIEADPYGVLTYGDAAALAPSSRSCLVRALACLSQTNPWFRSGNWQSPAIGALARPDMVSEFRTILRDPDAGFGIRSVVVDALLLGMPLSEMMPDLSEILLRDVSPYAERLHALHALLRLGGSGKLAVINAFRAGLGKAVDWLRIRIEIIQCLYGDPFGADDVIAVANDTLDAEGTVDTGMFWSLPDHVQPADFPDILDGINLPKPDKEGYDRRLWEVGSFYVGILIQVWRAPGTFDAGRMLSWLHKRLAFTSGYSESRARELLSAMKQAPDRVRAIADYFFHTLVVDDNRWFKLARFREVILCALSADALLDIIVECMTAAEDGSERQLFLYEAGFTLSFQAEPPHGRVTFEKLYALGDTVQFLVEARGRWVVQILPDGYFGGRSRRGIETEDNRERQWQEFDQERERIRTGEHLVWVTHLGRIYFAWYSDVDRSLNPRQRLAAWLGDARVKLRSRVFGPHYHGVTFQLSRMSWR